MQPGSPAHHRRGQSGGPQNSRRPASRTWLTPLLLLLIGAGIVTAILFRNRPSGQQSALSFENSKPVGQTSPPPLAQLVPTTEGTSAQLDPTPEDPLESTDKPARSAASSASSRFWEMDQRIMGTYLTQVEHSKVAGELGSLVGKEKEEALRSLLTVFNDPTGAGRLEALHLLLTWPALDEQTLAPVLRAALRDPDESLGTLAIGALAARNDEQAVKLLGREFAAGNASTRLAIVQAIAADGLAVPLLQLATSDADETVRNSAIAILAPSPTEASQGTETASPQ